jgi:hypothetical protein
LRLLIARVEPRDCRVVRIVPTEPAAPFFRWAAEDAAEGLPAWGVAPPDGPGGSEAKGVDPLAWYAVA